MSIRQGGRLGAAAGPSTENDDGIFRVEEVFLYKISSGWPIVTTLPQRVAPAMLTSAPPHAAFGTLKVNGGTLA